MLSIPPYARFEVLLAEKPTVDGSKATWEGEFANNRAWNISFRLTLL